MIQTMSPSVEFGLCVLKRIKTECNDSYFHICFNASGRMRGIGALCEPRFVFVLPLSEDYMVEVLLLFLII